MKFSQVRFDCFQDLITAMSQCEIQVSRLSGDQDKKEVDLESSGNISALQRYRWVKWCNSLNSQPDPRGKLLGLETRLRKNTQLEIALREVLQSLSRLAIQDQAESFRFSKKHPTWWAFWRVIEGTSSAHTNTQEIEEKIHTCAQEYWILERQWWEARAGVKDGPLTRAMDLWRSQPRWHMHRVLVEDCIGMGGCCARRCGCCDKRQEMLIDRRFAAGHCTLECSCCKKSRGYKLTWKQKFKTKNLRSPEKLQARYKRVMRASLVGLVAGSNEDPVDLIQPPRYEH